MTSGTLADDADSSDSTDQAPSLEATPADNTPTPSDPHEPLVEVQVLGPVHIAGLTQRFPQPKCLELITYLVFHPHGVEADTLMEALWPEQPPNRRRLNTVTSRARTTLGHDTQGELYLPHVTKSLYQTSSRVGSDLDRFSHHTQAARQASPSEAITHLHTALELIEAPPFSAIGNHYTWAHTKASSPTPSSPSTTPHTSWPSSRSKQTTQMKPPGPVEKA